MTKKEALDAIWMRCRHNDKTYEAYCVLMRELDLNELGCGDRVKPELAKELNELKPYEDAISRQEAIDIIESWLSCDDYNEAERHIMRATESILHDLPPVIPQPKMGHWEYVQYDGNPNTGNWHCSECRAIVNYEPTYNWEKKPYHKFCPMCGCKMQEVEDNYEN